MVNGTTPSGHRFELVQLISGQILSLRVQRLLGLANRAEKGRSPTATDIHRAGRVSRQNARLHASLDGILTELKNGAAEQRCFLQASCSAQAKVSREVSFDAQ